MKIHVARSSPVSARLAVSLSILLGACSSTESGNTSNGSFNSGNGGTTEVTGTDVVGGTGAALGGNSTTGVGGTNAGSSSTGGLMNVGGSTGGSPTIGTKATGGTIATGGAKATGGMVSTGGTKSAGGTVSTGGTKAATGGMPTTGGAKATGGMAPTGGAKATGGATATACTFPSAWNPGSPTYTTYSMPNSQTACGYNGSNNIIANIAVGANFAAIPDSSTNFANGNRCGACVQIGSAIITITDECPTSGGQNAPCAANLTGHLDLSIAAASAAGVQGDPSLKNQAAWKFIPCPITRPRRKAPRLAAGI